VRNAASEIVVCKHHNRNCGVAYCVRNVACEPVVIQDQSIEIHLKDFWRQTALEIVEPDINILDVWPFENNIGEMTNKTIVTDIKFIHKFKLGQAFRYNSTKPVRVDVEQCKICHKPQFRRKETGNVSLVKINAGNNTQFGVIKRRCAKHTIIGAHIGTIPVAGGVEWVRVHSLFPGLEGNVCSLEPLVRKGYFHIDLMLVLVRKFFIFFER
jgi:hypothetical protein